MGVGVGLDNQKPELQTTYRKQIDTSRLSVAQKNFLIIYFENKTEEKKPSVMTEHG